MENINKQPLPGVARSGQMPPDMAAMLLTRGETAKTITQEDIRRAAGILRDYKAGKANLEKRVVQDELWWELRHWEAIRSGKKNAQPAPEATSAWLFNAIANKHADAMDNFPEPVALPREAADDASAKMLSAVLPVVLEYNDFDQTYSRNWWEKLKHGTAAYGVFWDTAKENGLGDISVKEIDLLKLFWEPGVTDIQNSRNVFLVELVDEDILETEYPELRGKLKGDVIDVAQYVYDDTVDTSNKVVVVDWYYKVPSPGGKTLLHYVKFVGDNLLYASENDPQYRERGYYDHGEYPIVLDCLFPEKGTPIGFGYVAICKDPQLYIDKLSSNILENAMMATKRRFFASSSTNINVDQFRDWNEPIIQVEGELDDRRLKELVTQPLSGIYVDIMQLKIEEMKETASNRDVNSGGGGSGVTAAAAISALQEAGNKASRDMISASYRAHVAITSLCVELMRQFYDETRAFRITGADGYEFVQMNNAQLKDQMVGVDSQGAPMYRRPVFDIKIKAQKKNPFSRMEQNERAKELYSMGFFNPERAQEAMAALEMMDFEGIDKIREYVRQGATLLNMCQQLQQQNAMLQAAIAGVPPMPVGAPAPAGGNSMPAAAKPGTGSADGLASAVMQAQQPMTGYQERLAKRSAPSVTGT